MSLFSPYFSLDSSAFRVGNGGRLRCRMGASGIGIYVMLLSHLRDCRDCRAPLDYDMLAFDLHEDAAAVRRVVEDFGLFDIDRSSGTFTSSVLTTVRGMLSDDASAAGVGTTRTVRQRRVRSSGETYRRAVRRLAEDNALPPAEEEAPAEGDAEPAEEANATGNFAPTSIVAEGTPAEVKHESADAEGTPAEDELPFAEEANATGAIADARSPRTEEKRTEQNKKPHTPIVPFPQSGKGTRASHPAAAVVGAQEGGDASSEGNEEPVVGNPHSVPSASAERDAHPCAASPTVLGAPAQTLDPHPSPDTANGRTSVPNGTTSTENGKMSMSNSQPNTLTASEAPAHPQTDTAKIDTSVPNAQANPENGQTSAANGQKSMPNSQPNALTASEAPAHPQTDTAKADTSMPNPQADTEKTETSLPNSQPNTLTTSEKDDEAGHDEEGAGEPFVPPTANEVRRFAETLHHPEFDAEWFVAYYTERHWRRHNGRPVVSWQTTARYWLDHPLRVARHLLDHRPAASPVSVGVGGPSAVVVPAVCPTAAPLAAGSASFPSTGTPPVGTSGLSPRASASSPHSGTPHVGSLSLPAPTPLQQSRLSDLKGMVLHLFADAPTAAPTSATTASPSVCPARFISPAEAAQVIAQQTLAAAEEEAVRRVGERRATDSEEEARIGEISPTDAAKAIDAQVLSPADAEESVRACDDSTDEDGEEARVGEISPGDAAKAIDAQVLSPADAKEYVRAYDNSTDEDEEDALNGHDSTTDTAKGIDAQALSSADTAKDIDAQAFSTTDTAKGIDAQVLSPADTAKDIDAQAFSTTDAEEEVETQAFSTADAAKDIDAQAFSTADAAKDIDTQAFSATDAAKRIDAQVHSPADAVKAVDAQAFSTTDAAKDIDAQAFSTNDAAKGIDAQAFSADKGRWGVRSPRGPDPPTGDGHDSTDAGNDFADAENHFTAQPSNFSADRPPPAAVGTALAAVSTARADDPPIFAADECRPLRTLTEKHPYLNPSFHEPHPLLRLHPPSFGGFGRTFRVQSAQPPFGRPFLGRFVDIRPACTVGSRPLRPRLALCRTERGRCRPEHPDRECTTSANTCERSANAIRPPADAAEHGTDGHKTEHNASEHTADTVEHSTDERKNADFIDADSARGHKTERNAAEHPANAVSTPADERKRHDPAPEHPAYDPDAGQRLLDTAAHRRAVRAEREACCGALRHLAHCCVAF